MLCCGFNSSPHFYYGLPILHVGHACGIQSKAPPRKGVRIGNSERNSDFPTSRILKIDSLLSNDGSRPPPLIPFIVGIRYVRFSWKRLPPAQQGGHATTRFLEGFLEDSSKEVLLRRVLRRHLVRVSVGTGVLRSVLRKEGCA